MQAAIRAVIFDLDGVLVDTGPLHKQAWLDLAEREGWSFSEEFFRRTFGMQNKQIIPQLVGDINPEELERLSDWKEDRFRRISRGRLRLLDGVEALLRDLQEHRFALAVGSSAPRANLEFMLQETQARSFFDAVVCSQDVPRGKPAPDTFVLAAERLGVPAARCVVVEDAVPGVQAARAAGMAVAAITTTRCRQDLAGADLVVDRMAELSADVLVALAAKGTV
ncbi:MAG: HAD family phosphatase [Sedimentisphaerales bacterium]|nr:HAD family phosphatase [Sedimentisphaerales bacterium]